MNSVDTADRIQTVVDRSAEMVGLVLGEIRVENPAVVVVAAVAGNLALSVALDFESCPAMGNLVLSAHHFDFANWLAVGNYLV